MYLKLLTFALLLLLRNSYCLSENQMCPLSPPKDCACHTPKANRWLGFKEIIWFSIGSLATYIFMSRKKIWNFMRRLISKKEAPSPQKYSRILPPGQTTVVEDTNFRDILDRFSE
eukprot:Platyproteum_vivax@DN6070_c0_g1_i3.p1